MATNLTCIMRHTNANALDDITRLQTKFGVTGTPGAIYTVTVPTDSDERADTVRANFANDPNIFSIGYA